MDYSKKKLQKYKPLGKWSGGISFNNLVNDSSIEKADVIYLHWVNNRTLSVEEIGRLLKLGKPIILYLHDMWPFTGGCHYSFDCEKYVSQCSNCNILCSTKENDISYAVFKRKIKHFFWPHKFNHCNSEQMACYL